MMAARRYGGQGLWPGSVAWGKLFPALEPQHLAHRQQRREVKMVGSGPYMPGSKLGPVIQWVRDHGES